MRIVDARIMAATPARLTQLFGRIVLLLSRFIRTLKKPGLPSGAAQSRGLLRSREGATQTVCRSLVTPRVNSSRRKDFIRRYEGDTLRCADWRRERRKERSAQSLRLPAH